MIQKNGFSSTPVLMDEADDLREQLTHLFGVNKREEILRLLFEIAKRENQSLQAIYETTVKGLDQGEGTSTPLFRDIKKTLLERRYPSLSSSERSKVLLTRLRRPSTSPFSEETGDFYPKKITVEKRAESYLLTQKILNRFPEVPIEIINSVKDLRKPLSQWVESFGKDELLLYVEDRDVIKRCPCTSQSVVCNYMILNLGMGCPYDCSYCYLQFYQNTPAIAVPVNTDDFIQSLDKALSGEKGLWIRIGTGEYTDSLALDWLTEYSKTFVPYFKDKNVYFELKTKSKNIENLLDLNHGGRTVIAWTATPFGMKLEEKKTATMMERLQAARTCQEAGYPVAFHFDPVFYSPTWEEEYKELINVMYDTLLHPPKWLSLGTFRFHRDLKRVAEYRHPETKIFLGDQIEADQDGKFRYPDKVRNGMYEKILIWVKERDSQTPLYLCMESAQTWKEIFGEAPFEGRIDNWIAGK